ncbi:helix-turn-helix domain-containing protein [Gelidibacter salicanalis]|uniref:Helix-turn-helix transcriptional regulator n=1 Tax=Gelidibacter salicanalis TaxID=291193 RepID=A0A934NIX8_9FLAO|nr:AraC family transcriptional regulator [Gelidibacter salicanalis]MBJ7881743.1 helix-turn-helix transcriptional regulator [Gelidibacter salicanalis]
MTDDRFPGIHHIGIIIKKDQSTMTYLFFIGCFNAFFFLALLLQKQAKQLHDRILMFWLLYLAIATATYGLSIDVFPESSLISSGIIALFLLHGPFLYLYVSALTANNKTFNWKSIAHFIPFVAFVLYLIVASLFPEYSEGIRVDHVSEPVAKPPFLFIIFLLLTALSGPVYFFLSYRKFKRSKTSSLNFSSKDINLDWLGTLISIFGIVWTILILIAVIHHLFHLFTMEFCTNGLFLSLTGFIITIGYFGLKQKEVFIGLPLEIDTKTENTSKYGSSRMQDAELQKCYRQVNAYMTLKKPYLDPDLTLPKLAENLNVPTHHLSQVINEMHGSNFFDFINQFRVEEVKIKIQDPQFENYSLLGIALESGFNSKSAFNRVFKKITGTTPSAFKKSLPSS